MKPNAVYSVVFPVRKNKNGHVTHILLAKKTRKIFAGMWVGVGGVMDLVDTCVCECGCRETKEEIGRTYKQDELEEVGVIVSHEFSWISQVHFFLATGGKGRIRETKDKGVINPTWYRTNQLPKEVPVHYPLLLSNFLNGYRVDGSIILDPKNNILIESDIHVSRKMEAPR